MEGPDQFAMQGVWWRLQNYLQYLLMRVVVMSDASTEERKLTQSFGYDADGSWISRSTAAAVLVGGDFALEYPIPVPPKVHVSRGIKDLLVNPSDEKLTHLSF